MKKYILFPILLLAFGITFIQCTPMEKKYYYSVGITTADGYDCRISWSGCYIGQYAMPFTTFGSWGGGGGGAAVATGPAMKPIPDSLQLVYYSLPEDQFYGLKTALPQETIRTLFDAKYKDEGYDDPVTFFAFEIGIAPCGFVSLWITGGAGQILLDTYHAEKIDYNYRRAFPTHQWSREEAFKEYSEDLYPFIRQEQQNGTLSSTYWESLNQTYRWKLEFNDPDFSLYNYNIHLLNQENRMYLTSPSWPVTASDKTLPAELILYLKHEKDPVKYKVIITLRDQYVKYGGEKYLLDYMNKSRALLRFFESFYQKAGGKEVSVFVDFAFSMKSLKLKLKAGDIEEEFPFCDFQIYDSETYNYR